ncbi:hypothetical protein M422DRAFT_250751 [Sphaerobolus stellatus SS14]|uniref:Uncharacterized protein n=1 Tax=Sphaerobolus stellatus (strain SS14) TaxID=990650 RepID=A0A0C9VTQ2_SPHS4|nr:hypothetical protein M422DRAFT_250751 [Sphaerobolus stellatus SS14]
MDTQRLLAASSQSSRPSSSPLRHLRSAPVLIVSYDHAPARSPASTFVPSITSYTLLSAFMSRGSAIPSTMRRFHPHVKGLPPPPAIYTPVHLSTSTPFVTSKPALYLDAIHPHASLSASTCTSCAAHLSTFQACTRLHVMRVHPFTSYACFHAIRLCATAPPPRRHVSARRPSASAPCARWFFDLHDMRRRFLHPPISFAHYMHTIIKEESQEVHSN